MTKSQQKYSLDIKRLKILIKDHLRTNKILQKRLRHKKSPIKTSDVLQYELEHSARYLNSLLKNKGLSLLQVFPIANPSYSSQISLTDLQKTISQICLILNNHKLQIFLNYLDRDGTGLVSQTRYKSYLGCFGLLQSTKQNIHFKGKINQRFAAVVKKNGSASSFYQKYDQDGDGNMTILQLKKGLLNIKAFFAPQQILVVARFMDPTQKGKCTKQSFRKLIAQFDQFQSKQKQTNQNTKILQSLKQLIIKTKTNPMQIFNQADLGGMGIVTQKQMINSFAKTFNRQSRKSIIAWVKCINEDGDQYVQRLQYESFFKGLLTPRVFQGLQPKQKQSKKAIKSQKKMTTQMVLLSLKEKCKEQGISAKQLFYRLDLNQDRQISLPEFKQGLIAAGLSVSGALKIMSLFDQDGNGTVSQKEFVQAMGQQFHQQQQQQQFDDQDQLDDGLDEFALDKDQGDQALPQGHKLAKKIEKQQQNKVIQMEKRLAKAYAKSKQELLSFFHKYAHRQKVSLTNYYRIVGQILSISNKKLLIALGNRATNGQTVQYQIYLERIVKNYNIQVQHQEQKQQSKKNISMPIDIIGQQPSQPPMNVVIIKANDFSPISGFLRPFYQPKPEYQSLVIRSKTDHFLQDPQFRPSKFNLPQDHSIIFKPLTQIKYSCIIKQQSSILINRNMPVNIFAAFDMLSIDIFRIRRLFQNFDQKVTFFGIWLCIQGRWNLVGVDSYIPSYNQGFARCKTQKQQAWPSIIQKALAKTYKGYEKLRQLSLLKILQNLTGNYCQICNLSKINLQIIRDKLAQASERVCPIWAKTKQKAQHKLQGSFRVLDLQQVLFTQDLRVNQLQLVKLKSYDHPQYIYKGPMNRQELSNQIKQQLRYSSSIGQFWMPIKQFNKSFAQIGICWYQQAYFTNLQIQPTTGAYFKISVQNLPPCQLQCLPHKQGIGLAIIHGQFESIAAQVSDGYLQSFQTIKQGYVMIVPSEDCPIITLKFSGKQGFQFGLVEQKNDQEQLNLLLKRCALTNAQQLQCYDQCQQIVWFQGERLGIRFFYFLNQSKDAVLSTTINIQQIQNLKIARPYINNQSFSVQVAPGKDAIVKYLRIKPGDTGYVIGQKTHNIIKNYSQQQVYEKIKKYTRQFNKKQLKPGVITYKLAFEGKYYWMLDNKANDQKRGKVQFLLNNLQGDKQKTIQLKSGKYMICVFKVINDQDTYSLEYKLI